MLAILAKHRYSYAVYRTITSWQSISPVFSGKVYFYPPYISVVYRIRKAFYITAITIFPLTHWGRVTHICLSKLTIIDSDNGLSPSRRQAIVWTSDGILLIYPHWNANQNSYILIQENAIENIVRKMAAILSRPQCVKHLELVGVNDWNDSLYNGRSRDKTQVQPTNYISMNKISKFVYVLAHRKMPETSLTHCGLVTPYGVRYLSQHWFR